MVLSMHLLLEVFHTEMPSQFARTPSDPRHPHLCTFSFFLSFNSTVTGGPVEYELWFVSRAARPDVELDFWFKIHSFVKKGRRSEFRVALCHGRVLNFNLSTICDLKVSGCLYIPFLDPEL